MGEIRIIYLLRNVHYKGRFHESQIEKKITVRVPIIPFCNHSICSIDQSKKCSFSRSWSICKVSGICIFSSSSDGWCWVKVLHHVPQKAIKPTSGQVISSNHSPPWSKQHFFVMGKSSYSSYRFVSCLQCLCGEKIFRVVEYLMLHCNITFNISSDKGPNFMVNKM